MTGFVALRPDRPGMDEQLLELAILGVLAERTEIYPSHLVGELRRRAPALPAARVRPMLEELWQQRRVARLWHRYLLPDRVEAVRAQWLTMVDRRRADYDALDDLPDAYARGRAILLAWDGWHVDDGGA
jgi:hypothetical protein